MSINKTVDFDFLDRSILTDTADSKTESKLAIPYTIIHIPDMNDSVSKVILNSQPYYLRMQYLDTSERWMFSIYDIYRNPIILGIKIVPNFCLNLYYGRDDIPVGVFLAYSRKPFIGRQSFNNDEAKFIFIPVDDGRHADNVNASDAVRISDLAEETKEYSYG